MGDRAALAIFSSAPAMRGLPRQYAPLGRHPREAAGTRPSPSLVAVKRNLCRAEIIVRLPYDADGVPFELIPVKATPGTPPPPLGAVEAVRRPQIRPRTSFAKRV